MIGRHERAGLCHVGTEHRAQRRVEQMRTRVMEAQALPPAGFDIHRDVVVLPQHALGDLHAMDDDLRAAMICVQNLAAALAAGDLARVSDLTARLSVAWRLVQDDLDGLALARLARPLPLAFPD